MRKSEDEGERCLLDGGEGEIERRVRDDRGFFIVLKFSTTPNLRFVTMCYSLPV